MNNTKPIKALLFDLGNVVISFDLGRMFAHWAAAAGCETHVVMQRFRADDAYKAFERGEMSPDDYFAHVREQLDVPLSQTELEAGWTSIFMGIVPGVEDMLRQAAEHLPVYALTNSNTTHHAAYAG